MNRLTVVRSASKRDFANPVTYADPLEYLSHTRSRRGRNGQRLMKELERAGESKAKEILLLCMEKAQDTRLLARSLNGHAYITRFSHYLLGSEELDIPRTSLAAFHTGLMELRDLSTQLTAALKGQEKLLVWVKQMVKTEGEVIHSALYHRQNEFELEENQQRMMRQALVDPLDIKFFIFHSNKVIVHVVTRDGRGASSVDRRQEYNQWELPGRAEHVSHLVSAYKRLMRGKKTFAVPADVSLRPLRDLVAKPNH